jgi:PhnB protein
MKILAEYNAVMPYLIVKNALAFKQFMEEVFGATEQLIVPAPDGGIMHGEIRLHGSVIMFGESSGQFPKRPAGLFIYTDDADATYQKALAAGATTIPGQEPSDKDYGAPSRTCGVTDPFGNDWWITSIK